ncbi:hypothetical protein Ddc_12000 [Ditylenchus destructor]|nr:hypothetical protein Ddc_12000 [Ditylenchus destructor]
MGTAESVDYRTVPVPLHASLTFSNFSFINTTPHHHLTCRSTSAQLRFQNHSGHWPPKKSTILWVHISKGHSNKPGLDLGPQTWTWTNKPGLDLAQQTWTGSGPTNLDWTWPKNPGLDPRNLDWTPEPLTGYTLLPNNTPELLWSGATLPTFSLECEGT